jgi:hypothetical protein
MLKPAMTNKQRSVTLFENVTALHFIAYVMYLERYLLKAITAQNSTQHLI